MIYAPPNTKRERGGGGGRGGGEGGGGGGGGGGRGGGRGHTIAIFCAWRREITYRV